MSPSRRPISSVGDTSPSTCSDSHRARGPDESALYLRMDERAARIIVVPADVDKIMTVGWEVRDHTDLERVKAALDAAGVPFKQLSLDEADTRRVEEVIAFEDPAGTSLEVFHGAVLDHSPRHHTARRQVRHQ